MKKSEMNLNKIKRGMKILGWQIGMAFIFFIIITATGQLQGLKPSAETVINRQGGCVGVVGAPAEIERLELKEYDLKVATENYQRYPDSVEMIQELQEATQAYLEAQEIYEAYQQTEAYQEYLDGLACNERQKK